MKWAAVKVCLEREHPDSAGSQVRMAHCWKHISWHQSKWPILLILTLSNCHHSLLANIYIFCYRCLRTELIVEPQSSTVNPLCVFVLLTIKGNCRDVRFSRLSGDKLRRNSRAVTGPFLLCCHVARARLISSVQREAKSNQTATKETRFSV